MMDKADNNLVLIERELRFIAHQSQEIETSYDIVDEINLAVISALNALKEYNMKHQRMREEAPGEIELAA